MAETCKKYYYFRDHESENGWGIKYSEGNIIDEHGKQIIKEGKVIAKCIDKNYAAVIADALNSYRDPNGLLAALESTE